MTKQNNKTTPTQPQKSDIKSSSPGVSTEKPPCLSPDPRQNILRAVGNQGILSQVQTKLRLGQSHSPYEKEADDTAARIMNLSVETSTAPAAQNCCKNRLQPKTVNTIANSGNDAATTAAAVEPGLGDKINHLVNGGGSQLPDDTLQFFNSRFKQDFSNVRIHTGVGADATTSALNAKAYTLGNNIAFAPGEYSPHSYTGRYLLAHELTHVMQQQPYIARTPGDDEEQCSYGYSEGRGTYAKGDDKYYMWGTYDGNEERLDFGHRIIRSWIKWRFGASVDKSTEKKIYELILSGGFESYDIPLVAQCQYSVEVDVDLINAITPVVKEKVRKAKTEEAQEREEEAGLPPPPSAQIGEAKGKSGGTGGGAATTGGSKKGKKSGEGGKGTWSSGAEYLGNKEGESANRPAIPMTIDGLEIQPIGGIGTYSARLDYSIAGHDTLSQVVEAMNWVNFHWEVYNITAIARKGLGKTYTEQNKHNPLSDEAEIGKMEATGRRFEIVGDELVEDTETSIKGLINPEESSATGDLDELLLNTYANTLNIELLPVSAIIDYGGWAIGAFADLLSVDSQEREIPWPKKAGIYMIRVIAQPTPQGRDDEILRAPSVATKIVEVINAKDIAKDGLTKPKAQIAEKELELEMARKRQPPDPELITRLEKELADLKVAAYGSTIEAIKTAIRVKEEAAKNATGYQKRDLERQITELKKQLVLAEERETDFSKGSWRVQASFASEITGQTYPLLLQLGEREKDGSKHVFEISDVTSKSGERYIGKSSSRERAAWKAAKNFAGHNQYGRGYVVIQMPEGMGFSKSEETIRNAPTDTAIARKRLDDLVLALTALAIFVPGVGTAAAMLGAAVAAERLIHRWNNGTLYFDADAISDFIGLLGAVAQGASVIGKMRVIRAGNKFALASGKVNHTQLAAALARAERISELVDLGAEIIDWGGFAFGNLVVLDSIMETNQLELEGKISHAEARRRRASLLTSAIRDNSMQILGAAKGRKKTPVEDSPPSRSAGDTEPPVKKAPPQESEIGGGKMTHSTPPAELGTTPKRSRAEPAAEPPVTKAQPVETPPTAPERTPKAGEKDGARTEEGAKLTPPEHAPITGHEVVEAKAMTADKLHVITVLEDGRIIRCSLRCGEMRLHYSEFLNVAEDSPLHARAQELNGKLAGLESEATTRDPAQKQAVAEQAASLEIEMRALAADSLAVEFSSEKSSASIEALLKVFSPDEIRQLKTDLGITDLTKLGKPGKEGSVQDRTLRLLSEALSLSSDPETSKRLLDIVAGKRLTKKVEASLKREIRAAEKSIAKKAEMRAKQERMSALQDERARIAEERDKVRGRRKQLEAEHHTAEQDRRKYFHLSVDEKDPAKRAEYKQKLREAKARSVEATRKLLELDAESNSESGYRKEIENLDKQIELLDIILNPESHRAWLPCFAEGTLVNTPDGYHPIESLTAGDYVITNNLKDGTNVSRRIMRTYQSLTEHFYDIFIDQECIAATGRHPFWIADREVWLPAQNLKAGMAVRLNTGETARITEVKRRATALSHSYNLLIEQHHNYYVGYGILVHNGGEGGAIDMGMGDKLIYRGTNPDPKFAGKVYIGQSDNLDREQEHIEKAKKMLKRSDLTPEQRYWFEFMAGIELVPVVTGLDDTQADYLEQRNMEIEIKLAGGKKSEISNLTDLGAKMRGETVLMNRRRQLTSSLKKVSKKIAADERVHALGMCLD